MSNDCIAYLDDILEKLGKVLDAVETVTPLPPPTPPSRTIVVVKPPLLRNQVPLREVKRLNDAGRPVWRIYYDQYGRRICPKAGKELEVYNEIVKADGGIAKFAYRLTAGQVVDGRQIPVIPKLFILVRHTE